MAPEVQDLINATKERIAVARHGWACRQCDMDGFAHDDVVEADWATRSAVCKNCAFFAKLDADIAGMITDDDHGIAD